MFESPCQLLSIEDATFRDCPSLSSICIPSSIRTLCESCFDNCSGLADVAFESDSSLARIGLSAFRDCTCLSSICIPSAVETLCDGCFANCERLSRVTFEPNSRLSGTEGPAFSGCPFLSDPSSPEHEGIDPVSHRCGMPPVSPESAS
jgi:hypothetical protein